MPNPQAQSVPEVNYRTGADDDLGIEVLDLARFRARQPHYTINPFRPHRVRYFCLLYIRKGQGQHWIEGKRYRYRAGSVLIIQPQQSHAFDPKDQPEGEMINVTPALFSSCSVNTRDSHFVLLHRSLSGSPVLHLPERLNQSSRALLHELKQAGSDNQGDAALAQVLFYAWMIKLARFSGQEEDDDGRPVARFERFLQLVESHYESVREVSQYADWMHTNYKTLNLLCKRCSGRTAKQLIDWRVVEASRRKLALEGKTVQQTAAELSFDDPHVFNKYFKRLTDETPSAFKRRGGVA
ncbi:AraC family transcriptional regulator [Ferrimonas balearica]|uniref:AraC family transcriptional regulator n=1 Tax=Ferrimonas balearica TaxID=44012 RepID=UPI001C56BA9B|nr:helix-turn-helix transcriptional regulator [Ferrimonas balearica]MBW3138440.1 AraC family transcriptional regulator [Ferrimonas balearica]